MSSTGLVHSGRARYCLYASMNIINHVLRGNYVKCKRSRLSGWQSMGGVQLGSGGYGLLIDETGVTARLEGPVSGVWVGLVSERVEEERWQAGVPGL
jgi:hypothetical protein